MLPIKLKIRGIGPYTDEIVSFSEVSGDVIALCGENGSGKTFLFDSVFFALYRRLPSREGSVYSYCHGENPCVEFDFAGDNGLKFRTEIKINVRGREMEPWLFADNNDGTLIALTDGKNSTFDKKIAELFGPAEVALASVYAAQNKAGSFLSLPKAKRKELFIDLLGLGKLQVISDQASENEKLAIELYNGLHTKAEAFKTETSKTVNLDEMYKKLATLKDEVGIAEADVKLHIFEAATLKAQSDSYQEVNKRLVPLKERDKKLQLDYTSTLKAVSDAEAQASKVDAYRELASSYDKITEELAGLRYNSGELSKEISEYHQKLNAYNVAVGAHRATIAEHTKNQLIAERDVKRARGDAGIINSVPCHAEGECANCEFLTNAVKQRDAVVDLEAQIDEAKAAILNIESHIKAEVKPETEQLATSEARLKDIKEKITKLEKDLANASNAKTKLATAESAVTLVADLENRMGRIKSDRAEVDAAIHAVNEELKTAQDAVNKYAMAERTLEIDRDALDGANRLHAQYMVEITKAEVQQTRAAQAQIDLDALLPQVVKADTDRKSWNLLAKAFSKTGIQSLELDSAGPVIATLVNDLLFGCFGPRFSIKFVTQVQKDDGKGFKDEFDIFVTDAQSGVEGSIDDLSGGEKTIVCEAVSLAIALFNRSRSATGWHSLWRDEASSAIDDVRAPLYISMLRKARELGHFSKLYFIAHQIRVTENADSRIKVDSGHVTFE